MTRKPHPSLMQPAANCRSGAFGAAIVVTTSVVFSVIMTRRQLLQFAAQPQADEPPQIAKGISQSLPANMMTWRAVGDRHFSHLEMPAVGLDLGLKEWASRAHLSIEYLLQCGPREQFKAARHVTEFRPEQQSTEHRAAATDQIATPGTMVHAAIGAKAAAEN